MSAKAIARNEQFPSTFHIKAGDNVGTLLFKKKMWLSNEGGFAEVYGKKHSQMHKKEFGPNPNNLHEEKLLFKIRTAYDPIYGLWGILYEAKALLETYYIKIHQLDVEDRVMQKFNSALEAIASSTALIINTYLMCHSGVRCITFVACVTC